MSSLIPKISMFTLPISCLTTFYLPWFMDLTFHIPMQYCSLQHQTVLPSPVMSTTGCCCFGSVSSFFPELFLHWSHYHIEHKHKLTLTVWRHLEIYRDFYSLNWWRKFFFGKEQFYVEENMLITIFFLLWNISTFCVPPPQDTVDRGKCKMKMLNISNYRLNQISSRKKGLSLRTASRGSQRRAYENKLSLETVDTCSYLGTVNSW